jgi:hypothetical protein
LQKKVEHGEELLMEGGPFEETKEGEGFKEFFVDIVDRVGHGLGNCNTIKDVHADCINPRSVGYETFSFF